MLLLLFWAATLGGDGDGTGTGKGNGERGGGGGGGGGGGSGAQRVLDYGSGSGILGLSAARLGAEEVVGVEVDRDAIAAAHRNADLNGIGSPEDRSLFHCHLPPEAIEASLEAGGAPHVTRNALAAAAEPDCTPLPVGTAPFDVAVANILAGPLTQLAPTIAALGALSWPLAFTVGAAIVIPGGVTAVIQLCQVAHLLISRCCGQPPSLHHRCLF